MQKTRNLPSIKTRFAPNLCKFPWNQINIDTEGYIFLCACDAWVPFPVGHVMEFKTVEEIFNGPTARGIQNSVIDGNYRYCDTVNCFISKGSNLKNIYTPYDYSIHLGIDMSCNLQCPSCRPKFIFNDDQEFVNERSAWINRIRSWIKQKPNSKFYVTIGANGEPFASALYRQFLATEFATNVHYYIRTNATLIKKHIADLKLLPNLRTIELSLDAATAATYERVRRPGRWKSVVDNIDYLVELQKNYKFEMSATFVIQRENIEDIIPFVDFCRSRGIGPTFNLLQDWASFQDFDTECVHRPGDSLHQRFLEIIATPELRSTNPHWLSNYNLPTTETVPAN